MWAKCDGPKNFNYSYRVLIAMLRSIIDVRRVASVLGENV